jgi:hypothetical protein
VTTATYPSTLNRELRERFELTMVNGDGNSKMCGVSFIAIQIIHKTKQTVHPQEVQDAAPIGTLV